MQRIENALEAVNAICSIEPLAVFLDYDGTLTPIVDTPDLAVLSFEMRKILEELASRYPVMVLSGRDLADVRQLVGVESIGYGGSHGFEAVVAAKRLELPEAASYITALSEAEKGLREGVRAIAGALIERKKYGVAVHYRQVMPNQWALVEQVVDIVLCQFPQLRKARGKMVFELLPNLEWNKGKAMRWIQKLMGLEKAKILFIGDDLTDEDVFKELKKGEIGIAVMAEMRETAAQYYLKDCDEVARLLQALILNKPL